MDYCIETGVQGKIFQALELESACESVEGKEEVDVIWSTQLRSVPADLIVRPKPNAWTDGAASASRMWTPTPSAS